MSGLVPLSRLLDNLHLLRPFNLMLWSLYLSINIPNLSKIKSVLLLAPTPLLLNIEFPYLTPMILILEPVLSTLVTLSFLIVTSCPEKHWGISTVVLFISMS